MTEDRTPINLDSLSKPERQALNWTALNRPRHHHPPAEWVSRSRNPPSASAGQEDWLLFGQEGIMAHVAVNINQIAPQAIDF
jgi:hypothetical protein